MKMEELKQFVIASYYASPENFDNIIQNLNENIIASIIPLLFSGEYIPILDHLINYNNINNQYPMSADEWDINADQTLLENAIEREQVDLVKFLIAKGATISYGNLLSAINGINQNIDIIYIVLENVDSSVLNQITRDNILDILEEGNGDIIRLLFYRGVNFFIPEVYHIMGSNDDIANLMLDAGINVNGYVFELSPPFISNETILRIENKGGKVNLIPLENLLYRDGDYYKEDLGTVFIKEDGRYIVIGSEDFDLIARQYQILPPTDESLRLAELYNIEVRPLV